MNWIERMYDLKGKDLYSQNGEGLYLEYIIRHLYVFDRFAGSCYPLGQIIDIGGGDGFYLSNTRHVSNFVRRDAEIFDIENGFKVDADNVVVLLYNPGLVSIDIDGNDYWVLAAILTKFKPSIIIAEFNSSYTDSRTIKYDPDFVWGGDSYYGFTFKAGKKLAEANGYTVIFQVADMNMIMVRNDLIKVSVPPVTFKQSAFFKMSKRTDWVFI